ncbi:MAG: hypothetical protein WDM89_20405 [Rhizomicrobium sp.]
MRMNSAQTKVEDTPSDLDVTALTRADFLQRFGVDKRGVIRFPHYTRFLTDKTVPRLAKLYAPDFEVLGYKPTVPV